MTELTSDETENMKRLKIVMIVVIVFLTIQFVIAVNSLTETRVYFLALVKGNDQITWSDFSQFPHESVGWGADVYVYELKNGSILYLSGSIREKTPMYIEIDRKDGVVVVVKIPEEDHVY